MLKAGLVGCGFIGTTFHLPAWEQVNNAKIIAICDQGQSKAYEVASSLNIQAYISLSEMLSNAKLDIVDICTPNSSHFRLIVEALENDCHVIVEKPITTKAEELDRISKIAKLVNKKVMIRKLPQLKKNLNLQLLWNWR